MVKMVAMMVVVVVIVALGFVAVMMDVAGVGVGELRMWWWRGGTVGPEVVRTTVSMVGVVMVVVKLVVAEGIWLGDGCGYSHGSREAWRL